MILAWGVAMLCGLLLAYCATGMAAAVAFACVGASRIVASPITPGARVLLIPGAFAFWPYVIFRWLRARRTR
jgi:hypothetical protein